MKLEAVELIRLDVPLKSAFRTSEGSVTVHEVVWVHAITDTGEGWAEFTIAGIEGGVQWEEKNPFSMYVQQKDHDTWRKLYQGRTI